MVARFGLVLPRTLVCAVETLGFSHGAQGIIFYEVGQVDPNQRIFGPNSSHNSYRQIHLGA